METIMILTKVDNNYFVSTGKTVAHMKKLQVWEFTSF